MYMYIVQVQHNQLNYITHNSITYCTCVCECVPITKSTSHQMYTYMYMYTGNRLHWDKQLNRSGGGILNQSKRQILSHNGMLGCIYTHSHNHNNTHFMLMDLRLTLLSSSRTLAQFMWPSCIAMWRAGEGGGRGGCTCVCVWYERSLYIANGTLVQCTICIYAHVHVCVE